MAGFLSWLDGKVRQHSNHELANGVLYLKGGDLKEELAEVQAPCQTWGLKSWFADEFFETKQVVHVDLSSK
jgi:16S rRNA (guanine527-N7)-methyltransferase